MTDKIEEILPQISKNISENIKDQSYMNFIVKLVDDIVDKDLSLTELRDRVKAFYPKCNKDFILLSLNSEFTKISRQRLNITPFYANTTSFI